MQDTKDELPMEYPPLTFQMILDRMEQEVKDRIEASAKEVVDSAVRHLTAEYQLRDLSAAWMSSAIQMKQTAESLCELWDCRLNAAHDAYQPMYRAAVFYLTFSRANEMLGIPPEEDELTRRPDETPYEYIKRTEALRK